MTDAYRRYQEMMSDDEQERANAEGLGSWP